MKWGVFITLLMTGAALVTHKARLTRTLEAEGQANLIDRGDSPLFFSNGAELHLAWKRKGNIVSNLVGGLTHIERERRVSLDDLRYSQYSPASSRFGAPVTAGCFHPMGSFAMGRSANNRHSLLIMGVPKETPPQLGWALLQPFDGRGKLERLDEGIISAMHEARNWHNPTSTCGVIASKTSDTVWKQDLLMPVGEMRLHSQGKLQVLSGSAIDRNESLRGGERIWFCFTTDYGLAWSEVAPADVGQSPEILPLDDTGNALMFYATPFVQKEVDERTPWRWWHSHEEIIVKTRAGKTTAVLYVPRYPCPIVVKRGNAVTNVWREAKQILPAWRALEFSVHSNNRGIFWIAFTQPPLSHNDTAASNKTPENDKRVPSTHDDIAAPPVAVLRPDLPKWSEHDEKKLPSMPETQVMLSASRDDGLNWTEPIVVTNGKSSDWQPQVACTGDKVLVAWTRISKEDCHIWAASIPVDKVLTHSGAKNRQSATQEPGR